MLARSFSRECGSVAGSILIASFLINRKLFLIRPFFSLPLSAFKCASIRAKCSFDRGALARNSTVAPFNEKRKYGVSTAGFPPTSGFGVGVPESIGGRASILSSRRAYRFSRCLKQGIATRPRCYWELPDTGHKNPSESQAVEQLLQSRSRFSCSTLMWRRFSHQWRLLPE